MNHLLKVSLRQKAIFIPATAMNAGENAITGTTGLLIANLAKQGYGVSETLLKALNSTAPAFQAEILKVFGDVMGLSKNWAPLVKGWDTPTGETIADHIITFFANIFKTPGTALPCGHIIPANTFPLDRYNGCPFCGTPFAFGAIEHYKQGSEQQILEWWTEEDLHEFLGDLLTSNTALDATQRDSLKILLREFGLPDTKIRMKETLMEVIDLLYEQGDAEKAQVLFSSPTDILRYLWYLQTGFLQIIEPKTIIHRRNKLTRHISYSLREAANEKWRNTAALKLKYSRKDCLIVAGWLNRLDLEPEKMCEMMHPKRGMWVRFIRALRLAEYSKRPGFEKLNTLLDKFYKQEYKVWQAHIDHYRLRYDAENTFQLLKQRPGLFARSLFANMLWFGSDPAIAAFSEIVGKVPARLVFTLYMYAETYFDPTGKRAVKPLGGINKTVPANGLLSLYDNDQLESMRSSVGSLCLLAMKSRFSAIENPNKTIYIDPLLFKIPVSIGDRAETIQDMPAALMGTRFPVKGNTVRLFMQWGAGLPAQHLDMDLSCLIAYPDRTDHCSYSSLVTVGCKHSGDIRNIPEKTGTAEYLELQLDVLKNAGAKYITFTCNAFSIGAIAPNLVVGWMNSEHPMIISEKTGVAYDPSTVQHQVRVVNDLTKGLVFGVLEVGRREICWLEMPFSGQVVQNLDFRNIEAFLKKLDSKLSIGQLLQIKAEAQHLQLMETADADESYTTQWALNTAAVTKLLVD